MKYYSFFNSQDVNVIGHYHQTKSVDYPLDLYLPPYNGRFEIGEFLDFNPEVAIYLHPKAKITDFLDKSSLGFGVVLNKKVIEIFKSFNIPPHKYHPIKVIHCDKVIDGYFWMHYFDDICKYIDLNLSTIEIQNETISSDVKSIPVQSEKKVLDLFYNWNYSTEMRIKKIVFNNIFPNYDCFDNNIKSGFSYMSESLVRELKLKNITGFEFQETDIFQ